MSGEEVEPLVIKDKENITIYKKVAKPEKKCGKR